MFIVNVDLPERYQNNFTGSTFFIFSISVKQVSQIFVRLFVWFCVSLGIKNDKIIFSETLQGSSWHCPTHTQKVNLGMFAIFLPSFVYFVLFFVSHFLENHSLFSHESLNSCSWSQMCSNGCYAEKVSHFWVRFSFLDNYSKPFHEILHRLFSSNHLLTAYLYTLIIY